MGRRLPDLLEVCRKKGGSMVAAVAVEVSLRNLRRVREFIEGSPVRLSHVRLIPGKPGLGD